jgi:hypothetical protein
MHRNIWPTDCPSLIGWLFEPVEEKLRFSSGHTIKGTSEVQQEAFDTVVYPVTQT